MAELIKFTSVIEREGVGNYVVFPGDVGKSFGTRGNVKVFATFDGQPYRGLLATMGGDKHRIGVLKQILEEIGKKAGDTVKVTLKIDTEERVVKVPPLLADALEKDKKAATFFSTLSYTNRKEYAVWIDTAKKEETRDKRLVLAISKLRAGKKNPSEK